jgi:hypothetical protein
MHQWVRRRFQSLGLLQRRALMCLILLTALWMCRSITRKSWKALSAVEWQVSTVLRSVFLPLLCAAAGAGASPLPFKLCQSCRLGGFMHYLQDDDMRGLKFTLGVRVGKWQPLWRHGSMSAALKEFVRNTLAGCTR